MFAFLKKTTLAAVAATSFAVIGGTTEAATLNGSNELVDGGTYDINAKAYFFGVEFELIDGAQDYVFNFTNFTSTASTVGVSVATVLQSSAKFLNGMTASWTNGETFFVSEGLTTAFTIETLLAAGGADTLTLSFGDTVDQPLVPGTDGEAGLQMTVYGVSAVPVPAAGFLLLGALGGIAALRRRKTA